MKKNSYDNSICLKWITLRAAVILILIGWIANITAQPLAVTERADASSKSAPTFERIPLYRIQVRITTANVKDAGTDDDLYIQLNDRDKAFYLDRARDDFERNKTGTFDILPEFVKEVADIDFLTIGHKGSDAICLKKVELLLNDNRYPVYVKEYSVGKWLDDNQSTKINGNDMRSFVGWIDGRRRSPLSGCSRLIMMSMAALNRSPVYKPF